MFLHRLGQKIVGVAGERDRLGGVQLLGAGRGERQHLHVDAGGIHLGDAAGADVGELLERLEETAALLVRLLIADAAGAGKKFRRGEMLFESDGAHGWCGFLFVFVGWVEPRIGASRRPMTISAKPIVRRLGCP